jgi:hypothetical protein
MPFHLAPFLGRFVPVRGIVIRRQRFVRRCHNYTTASAARMRAKNVSLQEWGRSIVRKKGPSH